jgi:hypothetical protein
MNACPLSTTTVWSAQSHEPSPARRLALKTTAIAAEVADGFARISLNTVKSSRKMRPSQLPTLFTFVL